MPRDLERKDIEYDLPEDEKVCSCCGTYKLHRSGQAVTEQLDFIPAQLFVIRHIRFKYACRGCKRVVKIAPMPEQSIDKGLPGCGLLSEVLISKYQDHMPLYRQALRLERIGYAIARSTLGDWANQSGFILKPIVDAMQKQMISKYNYINSDDTIIPVLEKNKTHNGRLWVYIGHGENAPPCVVYQYSRTRRKSVPFNFLKGYSGYLNADAYAGYDECYKSGRIIEVACWAHARRKFVDAAKLAGEPSLADNAIEYIGKLYHIEKRAGHLTHAQRLALRRHQAKPILHKFHRWMRRKLNTLTPKSPVAKAMQYCFNHWRALMNYCRDGSCDIDNNRAERAIKSVVLGRKNYLFAGSYKGAENAAVIYSLIETCKLLNRGSSQTATKTGKMTLSQDTCTDDA